MKLLRYVVALLVLLPACNWKPPPTDCRTTGCELGLVCEEEDGIWRCVPATEPEPPISMLLRNNGTGQLVDLDGKSVDPFVAPIPCCRPSFLTTGRRAAMIMTEGIEILTGWPMPFKKEYRDYVEEITGGKANFYVGRPGPWFADETAEPEWIEWGGAYVRLNNGQADLSMFNEPFWVESHRRARNTCLEGSWILMGAMDKWWYRHGNDSDKANPMRPEWNVQSYDFRVGKGKIIPGSLRDLYLEKFVETYGPLPCILWEDGNEIAVGPYDDEFTLSMRDRIRHHEQTVGGGLVHLFGSEGPASVAADRVDMVIRHQQVSIPAPINNKPSMVNEYNPSPPFSAARMFQMYCNAVRAGTYTFIWRHDMEQAEYENALRLIAGGCGPAPPPTGCSFPQGLDDRITLAPNNGANPGDHIVELDLAMARVTGCVVRQEPCLIGMTADQFFEATCVELRAQGYCCGRHNNMPPGASDQISVKAEDFCDGGIHENYRIVTPREDAVRWSRQAKLHAWNVDCPRDPGVCGTPTPPPLHHFRGPAEKPCSGSQCCDATPYVCDQAYCRVVGFTDGRRCCAVRAEGFEDREACEHLVLGGDAAWASSTGSIERCNENHLRAKCPRGCAWIQVCDAPGTICNRKTF